MEFIKSFLLEKFGGDLNSAFNAVYKSNMWGCGSGHGSNEVVCAPYVAFLNEFFRKHNIKSIADCGCGDWQFSKNLDFSGINYVGYDVAGYVITRNTARFGRENISFHHYSGDFSEIKSADLLLCKDVLQHLPNAKIAEFIECLHKFKFALITNDIAPNGNVEVGNIENADLLETATNNKTLNSDILPTEYRTLDLSKSPFNLSCVPVFCAMSEPLKITMLWKNI